MHPVQVILAAVGALLFTAAATKVAQHVDAVRALRVRLHAYENTGRSGFRQAPSARHSAAVVHLRFDVLRGSGMTVGELQDALAKQPREREVMLEAYGCLLAIVGTRVDTTWSNGKETTRDVLVLRNPFNAA
jgi:hypothetical protein